MTYVVATQGFAFSPSSLTVAVNDRVTFQVGGSHNLAWNCAGMTSTGTFSRTFTAPGRYEYCCTFHAGMTGVIIVE
jgi:plastocyanin